MLRYRILGLFFLMFSFLGVGCGINSSNGNTSELCKSFKVSHLKMNIPRARHTMTTLDDGNIFIMGGLSHHHMDGLWTGEIFNPKLKTFKNTPPLYMARYSHVAVKLKDGRVLLLGGMGDAQLDGPHAPVEIFDPKTLKSTKIPNTYYQGFNFTANLLPDGRVLIVEGSSRKDYNTATDIMMFDPKKQTIESWGSLNIPRQKHSALTLRNGNVLVAGGEKRMSFQDRARYTMELIDIKHHKVDLIQGPEYDTVYPDAAKRRPPGNYFRLKYISTTGPLIELPSRKIFLSRTSLLYDLKTHSFEKFKPLLLEYYRVNDSMLSLNEKEFIFIGGMISREGKEKIDSVPAEIYNIETGKSTACTFYSDFLAHSSVAAFSPKGFIIAGGFGHGGDTIDTVKMIEKN